VARAWRTFGAAAVAGLAAGLIAASTAHAGFAPSSEQLSDPVDGVIHLSGAVNGAGNTIAVWDELINTTPTITAQVRGRWLSPGGSLGAPLPPLSGSDQGLNSDVAVGPDGRAFAAWQVPQPNGMSPASIKGRWIEPDGSLGPVLTLFAASSSPPLHDGVIPRVVVDPNGIATVVWKDEQQSDQVELRRVAPDGTLGPQLSPPIHGMHEAAALPSGATFIVGGTFGDDTVTVAANGSFGSATTVSTSDSVFTLQPGLAFDKTGDGLVAWRKGNGPPNSVTARRIDSNGTPFGPEITVEPTTSNSLGTDYNVAVDSNGHFLVGWREQDSGNDSHAFVRAVNLDGSLAGTAQPVSDVGSESDTQVALDDQGTGIAAFDFTPSMGSGSVVQARLLGPGGAPIGGPIPLSGPAGGSGATIANDPASGVAAVISLVPSGGKEVVVARRFLEPPTCLDTAGTVVQGRPIVVPLSCTGAALTGFQATTQPGHGSLAPVPGQPLSVRYTPKPGYRGSDSFLFQGLNDGGASANATVHIAVGKDTVRPVVTRLRLRRSRTAGSSAELARRRAAKVFYSFKLGYSEPSTAKVRIERPVRGVRKGKRCKLRRRGSRGRPCTLYKRVVLLSSRNLATSATLPVSRKQLAKLAKLRKLRASAVATDAAGNASKPRRLKVRFRA
jgi:hypothetical protein